MKLDILPIPEHGFMIIEGSKACLRALKSMDRNIARLTTQVGNGKLFKTEEEAKETLNQIQGIYCLTAEDILK